MWALFVAACFAPTNTIFDSACENDKSYLASLHKFVTEKDTSVTLMDTVYISMGEKFDEKAGQCIFSSPALKVKFTDKVPTDRTYWNNDFNKVRADAQFFELDSSESTSAQTPLADIVKAMVWRWDGQERMFEMKIKSVAEDLSETLDAFTAHGPSCRTPMPLQLKNTNNPHFQCIRIGYYPDQCERKLRIGPNGRKFRIQLGTTKPAPSDSECAYFEETTYAALFTQDVFGQDEADRTFRAIKTLSAPPDLEQDMITAVEGDDVFGMDLEATEINLPGGEWSYRSSRPTSGTDTILQIVTDGSIARAFENRPTASTKLMDLSRIIDSDEDGGTGANIIVFTLRDSSKSGAIAWKSCAAPFAWESSTDANKAWEELLSAKQLTGKRYCLRIRPIDDAAAGDDGNKYNPCGFFKAQIGTDDSSVVLPDADIRNEMFVTVGKAPAQGVAADCSNAEWQPSFVLNLKRDYFGRGASRNAWRMAQVSGTKVVGQPNSWSWKVDDKGFEIAFKEMFQESQEVFSFTECNSGKDSWQGGVVLTKQNPKQTYACLKLALTPDACEHAIGLENEPTAFAPFEVSLAMTVNAKDECEYDISRSFGLAFSNEAAKPGETSAKDLNWKKVVVDGESVSHPDSWRWASTKNGVMKVEMEVGLDANDFSKTQTIEFNGAQACEVGKYPDKSKWEMKASREDATFVCMKLSSTVVTSSDHYKQASVFETLVDLQKSVMGQDPDADGKPTFGKWSRKFAALAKNINDAEKTVATELSAVKVLASVKALTGESASAFMGIAKGDLTHYYSKRLPLGHPFIPTGKVMHTVGMHTRAVFIRNPRQTKPYTGLFEKERVPLIVRYAPSNINAKEYLRGWSFKFFREGPLPADDLVTYLSFAPYASCDAFSRVSNVPVESSAWSSVEKTIAEQPTFDSLKAVLMNVQQKAIKAETPTGARPVGRIGIAHLFLNDRDAWASRDRAVTRKPIDSRILSRTEFPEALAFIPDLKTVSQSKAAANIVSSADEELCSKNREKYMTKQLGSIKPGTVLFHVYAFTPSSSVTISSFNPSPPQLLGSIVTEDEFIPSWYGDALLHFKHEPYDSDLLKLHPATSSGGVKPVGGKQEQADKSKGATKVEEAEVPEGQTKPSTTVKTETSANKVEKKPLEPVVQPSTTTGGKQVRGSQSSIQPWSMEE